MKIIKYTPVVVVVNIRMSDLSERTSSMTRTSILFITRIFLHAFISDIYNKCAEANGGCSHICVWTLLGDGYECHCPSGYVLSSDDKTCFAAGECNMLVFA